MEIHKNIANVLLRAQETWGLSQNQFAKRLGISRSMLQKYLAAEEVNMSLYTLKHLANELNVSEVSLISGTAFIKRTAPQTVPAPSHTRSVKLRRKHYPRFTPPHLMDGGDMNA